MADTYDLTLRDALHQFWKQKTLERFGRVTLKNHGPGLIMSDEVLTRIVDCAHWGRIHSGESLAKETKWTRVDEYGEAILKLVRDHARPAPPLASAFVVTPLGARVVATNTNATASTTRTVRQYKCGTCGSTEHIGVWLSVQVRLQADQLSASNSSCPKFAERRRKGQPNENIMPATTSSSVPAQTRVVRSPSSEPEEAPGSSSATAGPSAQLPPPLPSVFDDPANASYAGAHTRNQGQSPVRSASPVSSTHFYRLE